MIGEQSLGLDDDSVEVLGQLGMHWVSHMYGPDVYETYSAEVDAVHERLHAEVLDLLPRPADASLWLLFDLQVVDMSLDCPAHPQFARLPAPDAAGRWQRAVRLHRHDDGSPGVEADSTVVCRLLGALATFGGQVSASVHPPRPQARYGAPETPAQAGARWRVAPLGRGLPEPDRPTIMEAWPAEEPRSALRDAVDMTPPAGGPTPAWSAVTASLWDVPVSPRDEQWIEDRPEEFLAALEEGMTRLQGRPELNRPLAAAAYTVRLGLVADQLDDAEDRETAHQQLVLRAAAAHLCGRASLFTFARELQARQLDPAAPFARSAAGYVTEYWRRALAGTVLLPEADTEQPDLVPLRALIGRELRRA